MIIFYEKIRNQLLDQSCENAAGPLGGKNDGTDPKWLKKSLERPIHTASQTFSLFQLSKIRV
jgi:hypothetical protein